MSAAAPHPAAELAALPGFPPSPISPPSPVSEVTEVQAAHGSAPALVQQPAAPAIHYVYPPPPPPPLGPIEPDLNAHDRPLRTSKLYVRIVTAVCVAISLILLLALGKQRSGRDPECVRHGSYCYDDYYDYHDGYDMISLPILAFAMAWNAAEFITFCVNKRGTHPGAQVAMDLLSWMPLLTIGVGNLISWGSSSSGPRLASVAAVLELLASIGHFVLFVMACVATHRRRHLVSKHLYSLQANIAAWQATFNAQYTEQQLHQMLNGKPETTMHPPPPMPHYPPPTHPYT